jgi:hypothetical protein
MQKIIKLILLVYNKYGTNNPRMDENKPRITTIK